MLPDDVLLEIFDSFLDEDMDEDMEEDSKPQPLKKQSIEEWVTLAHVCQRWRSVVFQSPRRLRLRLLCTSFTHTRTALDIWPPFPLIVSDFEGSFDDGPEGLDNIIAVLERNYRVCQIDLGGLTRSQVDHLADSEAMQKPFLVLTDLQIGVRISEKPREGRVLPDTFLGGSAPRLRSLELYDVPFPALPKLLLSAIHLVNLDLLDIPRSGYIPPETMAATLSTLTSLKSLRLNFRSPRPRPASIGRRQLPTRSILPSLTKIRFKGPANTWRSSWPTLTLLDSTSCI